MTILEDFDQVTQESLTRIDDIFSLATAFKDRALSDMDAMITAATAHITLLDSETFAPDYTGLDLTYTAPTEPSKEDYSSLIPADPTFSNLKTLDDFSFTNSAYTGLIKTEMQSNFVNVLGGELIIPIAVKNDIYQRALEKIQAKQADHEWAAQNHGASLGWELPSESTLAGLEQAQEESLQAIITLVVEESIAEFKERHDDVWKAMEQGTPFESAWMSDHHRGEDRELEAAKQAILVAINANDNLIRSNDLLLRQWALKWEGPLKAIQVATERYSAEVRWGGIEVSSEEARRGYEALELQKELEEEKGEIALAIKKAELAEILVQSLTQVANLMAAMSQGALAASDVSVGTKTSYGYTLSE